MTKTSPTKGMFIGKDMPTDGTVVAAVVVIEREDGSYSAWSGTDRFGGTHTQMPGDELRADIHDLVSDSFTIANL